MLRKLITFLDFRHQLEGDGQLRNEIEQGIAFRGTNLWILSFAIIVASVGLNTNSPAVIIGAMLISPLMGPINGIGFSIATYDFDLFKLSVKNFLFAVVASLSASTIYFALSPVSTAHSELLARINPTIYDVLIAFFGGLAGIVALSSRLKGNVLPGVAIATALMPPLCTAGYGMGTGQFNFFFGALYLFLINTVFIAIATVLITRYLRIPMRQAVEESQKKRTARIVYAVIVCTILPSLYFGYRLVQQERFQESAVRYCNDVRSVNGKFLLEHSIEPAERRIQLVYGGNTLSEEEKEEIRSKADNFDLKQVKIVISQGITLDEQQNREEGELRAQLLRLSENLKRYEKQNDSLRSVPKVGGQLLEELQTFYPQVNACSYASTIGYGDSVPGKSGRGNVLLIYMGKATPSEEERANIRSWASKRLKDDRLNVYFIPEYLGR